MINKKRIISMLLLLSIVLMFCTSSYAVSDAVYDVEINGGIVTPDLDEYANGGSGHFMERYKNIAVFIGGLATITMVGAVIYNVFRLNMAGDNPMQRQQCIRGIMICGICVALLGGATLFIGLFWGMFR